MKSRFQVQRRRKEKCRIWRSVGLAAVPLARPAWKLALLGGLILGSSLLSGCKAPGEEKEPMETVGNLPEEETKSSGDPLEGGYQTVLWQGEEYSYNAHLSNFLFLGIDTRETEETQTGMADAGQADALYLVSFDRVDGDLALISIPRDTMTQIEVFDRAGQSLGMTEQHISLSYGYGDGSYGSLELSEEAVENLFYGLPVQSACAMSLDGIPVLLESFGDVAVTVPNGSLAEEYPEFQEGAEAVITSKNAEAFLRWRDIDKTQSAIDRMERQQAFLQGFGQTAASRYADNPEGLLAVYEDLAPYLVSTVGEEWLLKMAESYLAGAPVTEWTVPGEGVPGEPFDEYRVDDSAFYEKIIETFYEKEE